MPARRPTCCGDTSRPLLSSALCAPQVVYSDQNSAVVANVFTKQVVGINSGSRADNATVFAADWLGNNPAILFGGHGSRVDSSLKVFNDHIKPLADQGYTVNLVGHSLGGQTCTWVRGQPRTRTHTHAHARTRTHAHAHARTHTRL